MSEESKLVQMRLQPKTIDSINHLSEISGAENKALIISTAVTLAEKLVTYMKRGSKVLIENPDGTTELLTIWGMGT